MINNSKKRGGIKISGPRQVLTTYRRDSSKPELLL